MPIRICSEAAGLEECFVEVDERWSIRELNRIYESRDAWLELYGRKVLAVNLLTAEGEAITDPAQVIERFDDLDIRLAKLVNNSLANAVDYLATLGEVNKRVSFGAGALAKTTMTTAPNSTTSTTTSGGGA
jgi:hypothetical protein